MSHNDGSSQGHFPLTTTEIPLKSRTTKAHHQAAMTEFNKVKLLVEISDRQWETGNEERNFFFPVSYDRHLVMTSQA